MEERVSLAMQQLVKKGDTATLTWIPGPFHPHRTQLSKGQVQLPCPVLESPAVSPHGEASHGRAGLASPSLQALGSSAIEAAQ